MKIIVKVDLFLMNKITIKKNNKIDLNEFNKFVDQGLNVRQIQEKMYGYSRNNFGKFFKEQYGIYPVRYVAKRRGRLNGHWET